MEVLTQPQFQILTHQQTGAKTGRIYFPAIFLAEYHAIVKKWLLTQEIEFDDRDIKLYGDGSVRIYFRAKLGHESTLSRRLCANSLKSQYYKLLRCLPKTAFA